MTFPNYKSYIIFKDPWHILNMPGVFEDIFGNHLNPVMDCNGISDATYSQEAQEKRCKRAYARSCNLPQAVIR